MRYALLPLAAVTLAAALLPSTALAHGRPHDRSFTYAVIGDTPYGDAQLAAFPGDVAAINADPDVRRVVHLGDIKNGSSVCSDDYFARIRASFDAFADPLVYTPGDNEWTDCHRANNGGYLPTERLAKVRSVFFDHPGRTLGGRAHVDAQRPPYVENVRWDERDVVFATLDVPGSDNDGLPWFGAAETPAQRAEREAEQAGRTQADLEWLDRAFERARRTHAAAVVLGIQADMWDPEAVAGNAIAHFTPIVQRLADRARAFGRPVLLLNGDSHLYREDQPLSDPGQRALYGIGRPVPNLTRITVQGSTNLPHEWLKLRVDPRAADPFSWRNVVLAG